jgi:hypothetical protein
MLIGSKEEEEEDEEEEDEEEEGYNWVQTSVPSFSAEVG